MTCGPNARTRQAVWRSCAAREDRKDIRVTIRKMVEGGDADRTCHSVLSGCCQS